MNPTDAPTAHEHPVRQHHVHQRHFDRLVVLADGVFAIALTLSALELRPEPRPGLSMLGAWGVPLLVYFFSFYLVARVWYQHRRAMAQLRHIDAALTVLTMVLLSLVALVPVVIRNLVAGGSLVELPNELPVSEVRVYGFSSGGFEPYALTMLMIQLCLTAAWAYAAFVARLAPDLLPARAKAWLLHDLSLTTLWATMLCWTLHVYWLAAVFLVAAVVERFAERRMRRVASAAEVGMDESQPDES
jgi:uncharacterized membrane protein